MKHRDAYEHEYVQRIKFKTDHRDHRRKEPGNDGNGAQAHKKSLAAALHSESKGSPSTLKRDIGRRSCQNHISVETVYPVAKMTDEQSYLPPATVYFIHRLKQNLGKRVKLIIYIHKIQGVGRRHNRVFLWSRKREFVAFLPDRFYPGQHEEDIDDHPCHPIQKSVAIQIKEDPLLCVRSLQSPTDLFVYPLCPSSV